MDPAHPEPIRVVVVDDHVFYRQGLAAMLRERGTDVVAEAASGPEAIEAAGRLAPDVVVMDLKMPGMSGLEATRRLQAESPASRVLVLTVSADEEDIVDAIVAGASGYLLKDAPTEEILRGIQAVAAGHSLLSPRIATTLMSRLRGPAAQPRGPRPAPLSPRELEVLALLADGRGNQEIAAELVISASTVRNHISSILLKLQVENRVQAAVRAVRDHLV